MTIAIHCCIKHEAGQEDYLFNAQASNLEQLLAGSIKGVFPADLRLYRCKQFLFRYDLVVNVWYFQSLTARQLYTAYIDTLTLLLATAGTATAPLIRDIRRFLELSL